MSKQGMENTNHNHNGLFISDLQTYIGESHILQGCSLNVGQECVSLLGRNGMGKTTLLRSIMGLTLPRSGTISWQGQDLVGMILYKIARTGIGYVPQGRRLFPSLSVEEHLTLIFRKIDSPDCWTPERVFDFFPELADRKKISGTKLNGGEQQMLAIGRALVTNAEALAEQIYIMLGGRTVYESAAQDFLENTELRQKYPGI